MISMIIHSSAQPLILFCTEDTSSMLASAVSLVSTGGWPAGLLTEIFHCCTLDSKAACGWVANVTSWTGTMPLYGVTLYQGLYNSSRVNFKPFSHSPALEGRSTLLAYKSLVTRVQKYLRRGKNRFLFRSKRIDWAGLGWCRKRKSREKKREASQ